MKYIYKKSIHRKWRLKMISRLLLIIIIMVNIVEYCFTQNLITPGKINNGGTIRVKKSVEGLRDSINGVFDFFGDDQEIPALQYNDLLLNGSGVKKTIGGDFFVKNNVTISNNVVLQVQNGSMIKLGNRLIELGYLMGSIQKDVNLDERTNSSDFGNIGATIMWEGKSPGRTIVTRTSGIPLISNGYESVLRYYNIDSDIDDGLNANIILKYSDNELNGHDPTKLLLWKSVDGGRTWKIQNGVRDVSSRSISKQGNTSFGLFTFADSMHPLGSLRQYAGILTLQSGNNQNQPIKTTLQPFVAVLKDSEGIPLVSEVVKFSIIDFPPNSIGQILSDTIAYTDQNGFVSSVLTLGDKVGRYTVKVFTPENPDNCIIFNATAYAGKPATLALISGNEQKQKIGMVLPNPLTISVMDSSGNAVSNVSVSFNITSAPNFAIGHSLSDTIVYSDSSGRASTYLKLGSKYGRYTITASIPGSSVTFSAYGEAFLADANDDGYANIADLTTVFDDILGKIKLSPENFTRADVDSNNTVDVRDAVIILNGLLKGRWDSVDSEMYKSGDNFGFYKVEFEVTSQGLRFNLINSKPVKGIQIALRLRNSLIPSNTIEKFNRGKNMQIPVEYHGDILRIILNNSENIPIDEGIGSLFRIPFRNLSINDFEVLYTIVSTNSNEGIYIPSEKIVAPNGKYPENFALDQNYPNPFNSDTKIRFYIPDNGNVSMNIELVLFDLSGKKIRTLVVGSFEPGIYTYRWDGTDDGGTQVSSGMYIYRLSNKERELVRGMIFVK